MGFLIPDFKCPACGGTLLAKEFKPGRPWTCSDCSKQFRTSRTYKRTVVWILAAILLAFFSSQGVRGWQLLVLVVVFVVPSLMISIPILYRAIPPRLEPYQPTGPDDDSENASPRTSQPEASDRKVFQNQK
jgi:hypothetical protein